MNRYEYEVKARRGRLAEARRTTVPPTTCRHCERRIEQDADGLWIDPEATGDDSIWRETCDAHDTFMAEHEPAEEEVR